MATPSTSTGTAEDPCTDGPAKFETFSLVLMVKVWSSTTASSVMVPIFLAGAGGLAPP